MMGEEDAFRYTVRFTEPENYFEYEKDDDVRDFKTNIEPKETKTMAVRDMIKRFESGIKPLLNSKDEKETRARKSFVQLTSPGTVNSIHAQLAQLFPDTNKGRDSSISVNSILSGISEVSFSSDSSGIGSYHQSTQRYSERRSTKYISNLPPTENTTHDPDEDHVGFDRKYSCSSQGGSPIVMRRRQPPVMRRKSVAENFKEINGETIWTYGVQQTDLRKLLKNKSGADSESDDSRNSLQDNNYNASSESSEREDVEIDFPKGSVETTSTDHSTETLIEGHRNGEDSEFDGNSTDSSGERYTMDNVSIRSVSSFDMIPYQKYDSITVSSDEYGAEVCSAPNNEFLTVSAVNEWCISKAAEPILLPSETKKEKYRRRLNERVNELLHTEGVYVEKLRHVVSDYIPEMSRLDLPSTLRGLKFDIFANIEKIYKFHSEELLPALRECENDLKKLGRCFRQYEQQFQMYVIYSRNNKRSNRLVYEHKDFFQEKQIELGERLDLSSYLLEPVQRIPRYKLFLDDLVKTYQSYESERHETDSEMSKLSVESSETGGSNGESDNDETVLQSLQMAKATVERLLTAVDDIIALENIRDCPINLLNQGKLLRQQEFTVTDQSKRRHRMRVFLFEKVVLLTAVYKKQLTVEIFPYRDHIPMDDLGITPKEHDIYKFTVWYKKRTLKSYKLETTDADIRTAWVEEIMALLWKQAMEKKELLLKTRRSRNSVVSVISQQSSDGSGSESSKYNSLRGVPGEVKRALKCGFNSRRTTWYCE